MIKGSIDIAYCTINSKGRGGNNHNLHAVQILMNELLLIKKQGIKDKILFQMIDWCSTILNWEELLYEQIYFSLSFLCLSKFLTNQ